MLQTYDAIASDYVTATVIQQALGGHAIPIDRSGRKRVLGWVRGVSESEIPASFRAGLVAYQEQGAEFLDLIEDPGQ